MSNHLKNPEMKTSERHQVFVRNEKKNTTQLFATFQVMALVLALVGGLTQVLQLPWSFAAWAFGSLFDVGSLMFGTNFSESVIMFRCLSCSSIFVRCVSCSIKTWQKKKRGIQWAFFLFQAWPQRVLAQNRHWVGPKIPKKIEAQRSSTMLQARVYDGRWLNTRVDF